MEPLGERPIWSMGGGEKLLTLDRVDAELARLETFRLHVIAGLDADGYAAEIGAHDTAQLLEFRYRLDRTRARRDVHLARTLAKYTVVSATLPTTEPAADDCAEAPEVLLRPAQAEAIVSALDKVPTTVPADQVALAEHELVGLARHLSPAELRKAGTQIRDILDTDGPEPEEHKAYARETLTLSTADRGVKFRGYLANENAELLRTLIHTAARPHKTLDSQPDPRTREKRQADALTTVLTLAATTLDTKPPPAASSTGGTTTPSPSAATTSTTAQTLGRATRDIADSTTSGRATDRVPGFGAKANITVTIDLQDLKTATADAIGDTVYGDGLSAATIRRLACDARIIPLVLGSNSEPLDVGRSERLVTRAQRRALNSRDKGCVVCGAPPIHCDAHHLISWINGGETKISNLVLLCRRHHIDLHAGHWTITITNGKVHVDRPTWADPRHPSTRPLTPQTSPPEPGTHTPHIETGTTRPGPAHTGEGLGDGAHRLDRHAPSQPSPSRPLPLGPAAATTGATASSQSGPPSRPTGPIPRLRTADTSLSTGGADLGLSRRRRLTASLVPSRRESGTTSSRKDDSAVTSTVHAAEKHEPDSATPRRANADSVSTPAVDSTTFGTVARRSAIGRELLNRLTSAGGQGTGDAATVTESSLREAACLAIWGEPATIPDDRRTSNGTATANSSRRFDPWGEPAAVGARSAPTAARQQQPSEPTLHRSDSG